MRQLGQYPAPRHAIAHLSDPHLIADNGLHYGVMDNEASLRTALERLSHVNPPPQALVFTGDLADQGEPDAYARLRAIVEPAAEAMGAVVVWTMGNHDDRVPYARGLFDSDDAGFQDRTYDIDGLRIIALDTSVPGYHHGELRPEQLQWLADELATPAEHGTILAMHHPPLPLPMVRPAELIELRDQHLLADVVAGTDVRGILAGHLHFSTWSTFADIPVNVSSASCYTIDPAPVDRFISSVDNGQSFTMVHAYEDRLVHTLVPLDRGTEIKGLGMDIAEAVETIDLAEAIELASSKTSPFND
jgi:Icc protein